MSARRAPLLVLALLSGLAAAPAGAAERISKDVGPTSTLCDGADKSSAAWTACIGAATAAMPENELFYAGYWLAKTGRYAEALRYLELANQTDPRVLTYIGFATRKLGKVDEALPLYGKALEIDPSFVVARAYLGEAFLTKGEPGKAEAELIEIEKRCGTTCPAFVDLKSQIETYRARQG